MSINDPARQADTALHGLHRRARDRSVALLLVGTVVLMPPIAAIFRIDGTLFGVPFLLVYIFVVWLLLVAGAAALARPLESGDTPAPSAKADDAGA